jgi:hypothetical protein
MMAPTPVLALAFDRSRGPPPITTTTTGTLLAAAWLATELISASWLYGSSRLVRSCPSDSSTPWDAIRPTPSEVRPTTSTTASIPCSDGAFSGSVEQLTSPYCARPSHGEIRYGAVPK